MTFQPGDPKPPGSGRKPGQPNRTTAALRELVEAETDDVPIPVLLARWGQQFEAEQDRASAIACMIAAMHAVYPKLKAVEVTGEVDHRLPHLSFFDRPICPYPGPPPVDHDLKPAAAVTTTP